MTVYDKDFNEVADHDLEAGHLSLVSQDLIAAYTVTKEGVGEYVTVAEYDNGGKDVEWQWSIEPEGEWHFCDSEGTEWANPPKPEVEKWWDKAEVYPCRAEWQLYTPYTEQELAEIAEEQAKAEEEQAKAEEQAQLIAMLPDLLAEMSTMMMELSDE